MAHDADPRNQAFRAGQDRSRGGRDRRRLGRDDDNLLSDRLDQLQSHLQNAITDPDDLSQANELLSQLLEAMPSGGADDASNDPEAQRKDPDLFLKDRRAATDGKLSDRDWDSYDALCKARDAKRAKDDNDPGARRNPMAGDQRPRQEGKLAGILAAKPR